jgi:hypothetical protein
MVTPEINAHRRADTAVAVNQVGRQLATRTTTTTTTGHHLALVRWADQLDGVQGREWAGEDCRHRPPRLEAGLLAAGERIKRVSPKLMAHARASARTYGKSSPSDALAVAWGGATPLGSFRRPARRAPPGSCVSSSTTERTWSMSGPGCIRNGTAPLSVRSGNQDRHRLARTGNRQINAAIHGIAVTQACCHPEAQAYLERRNTKTEARRTLGRQLSDAVFQALLAEATAPAVDLADAA